MKRILIFSVALLILTSIIPLIAADEKDTGDSTDKIQTLEPSPFFPIPAMAPRPAATPQTPVTHPASLYVKSIGDTVACPLDSLGNPYSITCYARGRRSYPPLPFIHCDPGDVVIQTAAFLDGGGPYAYPTIFEQENTASGSFYATIPAIVRGSNPPKIVLVTPESIAETDLGGIPPNYVNTDVHRWVVCLDTSSFLE